MHQRNHSEIDGKSFLSESTISLICDIKITKDEKDKRNLKNQASKNNTQEWDIQKAELNELTKINADGSLAWMRKLQKFQTLHQFLTTVVDRLKREECNYGKI